MVDRKPFPNPRVMVRDEGSGVARCFEVAHPRLRPADEAPIAEDHPRLLRAGEEAIPEELVNGWNGLISNRLSPPPNCPPQSARQQKRKHHHCDCPSAIRRMP